MKNAVLSLFALGWIDLFNPVAISMVMLLIPLVRKSWHTLLYVFGAYIAYTTAAIGIFFGVDKYLSEFYNNLCSDYPLEIGIAKAAIGIASLLGCFFMVRFLVKAAKEKRELSMDSMLMIKSIAPWFIVALSFGSTWSNIFSAVALFAYIGVLMSNNIQFNTAILLLPVFCLFSMVPTMSVYILSNKIKGEKFQKIMDKVRKIMTGFCFYSIPVILIIIAWWGISGAVSSLAS